MLLVLRVSDIGTSLWKSGFQPQSCEVDQESARVEISLCPVSGNGSYYVQSVLTGPLV